MSLTFLALLLTLLSGTAEATGDRMANWHEDLRALESGMAKGEKDFARVYPRLTADLASLEADLPKLSDAEATLRLMKIVATAHIAHNVVRMPVTGDFAQRLPLVFTWYSDGLAVTGSGGRFAQALGTRVLRIGDKTPEEVLGLLSPYVSHENTMWLRQMACEFLRRRVVLRQLGVVGSEGPVQLVLAKPGGTPFTFDATFDAITGDAITGDAITIAAGWQRVPLPVLRKPGTRYWHTYLADSQTLFIQYNACVEDPELPFADFARKVLADADGNPVKRVVIDLRDNMGGNSAIIRPLKTGLRERLKTLGPVYVVISGRTFSSGVSSAMELRGNLHAKLVGEPTGGSPSTYGDLGFVNLPNSKLVAQYSTKWFGSHSDTAQSLMPDLPAPELLEASLAGRDAAMEKVLAQ